MENNISKNTTTNTDKKSKSNIYDDVLEKRTKPDLFNGAETESKKEDKVKTVQEATKTKTYAYEEAMEKSTIYFKGDTLAANVWINKYSLKDAAGNLYECTPDDMHRRIAKELARIEKRYPNPLSEDEIFDLLKHFKYIVPQGSPMA